MHAELLHVVCCISNPARYSSRIRLYRDFARHMKESGVVLYTVEAAFGDRPFEVTEAGNPRHLQLRTSTELWHKEQLLNLGVERLVPADAEYIAFIDADVHFQRRDWAAETIHQLQHYDVVQCFSDALDLGPKGEVLGTHQPRRSFCYQWHQLMLGRNPPVGPGSNYAAYWHPGYAWAMTHDAYDKLGGLLDICIVGSADYHMAVALIGKAHECIPEGVTADYADAIMVWSDNALQQIKRNIGYVDGTLLHAWHGKKTDRGYMSRVGILTRNRFSPTKHLLRDANGLYRLRDERGTLRDDLRFYFRSRNEDSIDL